MIMIDPGGTIGKLDRMGLPEEHHPCGGELADDRAVLPGDVVGQQTRTGGRGCALHIEEILRGIRDAVQGSQIRAALQCALGCPSLRQRPFWHQQDKGVEPRVERFNPPEQFFGTGHWAELARADAGGQAGDRLKLKRRP